MSKTKFIKYKHIDFLRMDKDLDDFIRFTHTVGCQEEYYLNEAEQILLQSLIKLLFESSTTTYSASSYGLKHIAENILGFYVGNADLKRAMVDLGFTASVMERNPNWYFYIKRRKIDIANNNQNPYVTFMKCYTDFLLRGKSRYKELRPNG